jgi:hypothetical protein
MITSQARRRIATGHAQAEKRARTPANEALRAAYKKPHKYKAKPRRVDGIYFASELEVKRYSELKLLERAEEITGLACHTRYKLTVNGIEVAQYVDDFSYFDRAKSVYVFEDVKGVLTDASRIKLKLMKACHNIDVQLVKR